MIDHIALNVEDDETMLAFYTEILMLEPERREAYCAHKVPFPSVRLNADTVIDLFPEKMWRRNVPERQEGNPLSHFCLAMEKREWEALSARLRAAGITLEEGPVPRWGAHGTGTSIYFRDPEGNLIEARYYEEGADAGQCLLGS